MYRLVESIRIEGGVPANIEYHQTRLEHSFRHFCGERTAPELSQLIEVPKEFCSGTVKCRFLYCDDADSSLWKTEFAAYSPRSIKTLKLVYGSLNYNYKLTDRRLIDELTAQRDSCDDIVIVRDGLITDTGFSNIVFLRGGQWFTPAQPLLKGTARAGLLDKGVISECGISAVELGEYEGFRLINAMLPFAKQPILPMEAIIR